jgi:glutamine amidotransferase/cyclase
VQYHTDLIGVFKKLLFPGVGAFGQATNSLVTSGLLPHLQAYISSGRPYFGICIGMQVLFESSSESPSAKGLGVIPYPITRFSSDDIIKETGRGKSVPHMGWNSAWRAWDGESEKLMREEDDYYFVHSYAAIIPPNEEEAGKGMDFTYTLSRYGNETFISSVRKGNVLGTQFHPEKSGPAGLDLLQRWLSASPSSLSSPPQASPNAKFQPTNPNPSRSTSTGLTSRIVACLDVRSNDQGDLVVTKGDQYDVREKSSDRGVRNLGKPVELSQRYYKEGADEICFLNITSFRSSALTDQPMLEVVKNAAETVFVPLTVGGGIKDTVDPDGTAHSALEVAGAYFRSGADKVSIGSEAVLAVEEMLAREAKGEEGLSGKSGIECISKAYGSQAVVVSIDPRRMYVDTNMENWIDGVSPIHRPCLIYGDKAKSRTKGEEKGKVWWYACTISGGRSTRDLDVIQLAKGVERLGAGEVLLNSIDRDGTGLGFDLDLVDLVRKSVGIPVVASSGAGKAGDFVEVFEQTGVEAALAAGIFHRSEVGIDEIKQELESKGLPARRCDLEV